MRDGDYDNFVGARLIDDYKRESLQKQSPGSADGRRTDAWKLPDESDGALKFQRKREGDALGGICPIPCGS